MLEVSTAWSTAEIYLQGAHVTHFTKKNEPPLLFVSQCSRFEQGQPIRGGIPVIFPWFGPREGLGQHGFARIKTWELKEFAPAPDGSVSLRFRLPDCPEASAFQPFNVDYIVTVSESLKLELAVTNNSKTEEFVFENCLHTYFEIGDIKAASISGLRGTRYLDKVANLRRRPKPMMQSTLLRKWIAFTSTRPVRWRFPIPVWGERSGSKNRPRFRQWSGIPGALRPSRCRFRQRRIRANGLRRIRQCGLESDSVAARRKLTINREVDQWTNRGIRSMTAGVRGQSCILPVLAKKVRTPRPTAIESSHLVSLASSGGEGWGEEAVNAAPLNSTA